jgi:molybdopterin converting factor small subunit
MARVTVRYFAGARAAAGAASEPADVTTIAELTSVLAARHGERLSRVLDHATLLVDGVAAHDVAATLPDGATVEVLPPFAGG